MASRFPSRVDVFALDIAQLYLRFVDKFPDPTAVNMEEFTKLYDDSRVEYLFYSSTPSLDVPYQDYIVDELLQLSVAYLFLPFRLVRPHVRPFSLLLAYLLYATQPSCATAKSARQFKLHMPVDVMEELLRRTSTTGFGDNVRVSDSFSVSTPSSLCIDSRGEVAMSRVEVHVLCALQSKHAFMLEPFVDARVYLAALITAHDALKAPLLCLGDIRSQLLHVSRSSAALRSRDVLQRSSSPLSPAGRSSPAAHSVVHAAPCLLSNQSFASELAEYEGLRRIAGL